MSPRSPAHALVRLGWTCVVLMLVVTTASAWLRLAQPRPACHDWPGCRDAGRPSASVASAGPPALLAVTRGAHRVAASAVLVAVVALVALAWRRRPRDRGAAAHALALLALALGLAVLGIVTPGSRAAAVVLGNLLGGLLMLALSWRLLRCLQGAPAVDGPLAGAALAGMLVWLAQAALGAAAGGGLTAAAPVAHLALALLALPLAFGVGWSARRQRRGAEGVALMMLAPLQGLLGAAGAANAAAPALVLLHNVVAAVGLALLCGLSLRRRAGSLPAATTGGATPPDRSPAAPAAAGGAVRAARRPPGPGHGPSVRPPHVRSRRHRCGSGSRNCRPLPAPGG